MEKICTKCHTKLDLKYFHKSKNSDDGHFYICKKCESERKKQYYKNGYNKIMKYNQIDNKDKFIDYNQKYYSLNVEREKSRNKLWRDNNKDKIRDRNNQYYKNNPQYNIRIKLSNRVRSAIKKQGKLKTKKTEELIGCTYDYFINHIQNLFTSGMTMELLISGDIHIDHIIPCDAFDLTITEHQLVCFNYRNLQPLWKNVNLSKNNKHNITNINEFVRTYFD